MDRHGWRIVYATIVSADRAIPRTGRRKRYSDPLIVAMFLWTVTHDRPMCWACQRSSYGSWFRPRKLPSVSAFSRRLRSERCQRILREVEGQLADGQRSTQVCFLDARPLVVGPCSKDRQAKPGRIYGGFARGYKLHAIVSGDGRMIDWTVRSLNEGETTVAETLVEQAPLGAWLLADGNYDSGNLYDRVSARGCQLLTPLPPHAGQGHRRQSAARLRALDLWTSGRAEALYAQRAAVERYFGQQSSFGGGLAPLPAWVRSLRRVTRWVAGKLIVYHVRLRLRKNAA